MQIGAENREGDTLMENIITEAMHDILESDELEDMLDAFETYPAPIIGPTIEGQQAPSCNNISEELVETQMQYVNQNNEPLEAELKELTGMDDTEIFKKRMYLDKNFVDLLEYMLEDTIFNLMEEATYEEFDLTQAPKIYIKKEDVNLAQQSNE